MSFQNIKGQDNAVGILQGHLKQGRLSHGYLFTGPEGIGKAMTAKAFAKAINCRESGVDSCGGCPSCLKIENNNHPDVHLIGSDNETIKIEQIRQAQREAGFRPYEGKQRVFIFDNAHNLTAESANALLKVLEEPPGASVFILISSKTALLFKTVISRCKAIKFYPLKRAELEGILKKDYGTLTELSHFLAYFSEGRIGRALRLKDTPIFQEKNQVIDAFIFPGAGSRGGVSLQDKDLLGGYLNILATWFRDLSLAKIGMPYSELINADRRDELSNSLARYSFEELNEAMRLITDSLLYLEQNVNIKLLVTNLQSELIRS